ncbi:peptidase M24, structural domain-containing protein [Pseudomassariella vexata]|uniref:Peptidase M24, structural domain-containing protein n=1 Tax=Pseudomassariella vexata TaxID=1141098 RepID=A0A1Y2DIW8_9PEZI|nr:peptidase M24, structural domain-containing protein [Pseudomassariella vexata]ORY59074.1 peptidase M24, structural domain-containing protein [Pseudomassariella vexata]
MADKGEVVDYSLNNPDTLTKYKVAGTISEKVLAAVSKLCVAGEKIVTICEKGDKLLEEEVAKVYAKTKLKGFAHPTTVSPATFVTPYTPLSSDEAESKVELQPNEPVKIQLGAQIDGFGTIVCGTVVMAPKDEEQDVVTGRSADLILATHYANELLLRLMMPPGLLTSGTDEEKAKAASAKPPTQARITSLLETITKSYECNLVESTTSWLFERGEIEGKKKVVIAPGEGTKGDGIPEVGEVWGVEMGVSLSSGKVKSMEQRPTLHRLINDNGMAKRPTSKKLMYDVKKNFHHFPFSLRQLESERDAKLGVLECVRNNLLRQYEVVGDKDGAPVARLLTTIAITKNGVTKLGAPPALDVSKFKSDKKITDEEVLKILEQPLSRNKGKSKSKKKKKPAKKAAKKVEDGEESEEESDDEE